jgi:hypothetical protein
MDFEKGCEECGIETEQIFNTITDNKPARLCYKCAISNDSIILEEEIRKQKEKMEMKRLQKQQAQEQKSEPKTPSLNDLWARYKKVKEEREQKMKMESHGAVLDEKQFVEDLEKKKENEKIELLKGINEDIIPSDKEKDKINFNTEATKKIKIKDFFKRALDLLKEDKKEDKKQYS